MKVKQTYNNVKNAVGDKVTQAKNFVEKKANYLGRRVEKALNTVLTEKYQHWTPYIMTILKSIPIAVMIGCAYAISPLLAILTLNGISVFALHNNRVYKKGDMKVVLSAGLGVSSAVLSVALVVYGIATKAVWGNLAYAALFGAVSAFHLYRCYQSTVQIPKNLSTPVAATA